LEDFSKVLVKVSERALESTGIRLHFSVKGTTRKLEPVVEGNLLRICEEAVANAAKHADPRQVEVSLAFEAESIQLRVRDDGCGFNPQNVTSSEDGHFGLVGIQERVKSMNADLAVNSHPGAGTEITVTVVKS
jgi:signal transduction histidine kinase